MLKILKYLKSYIWQILLLLVLVVITVDTNLRLPDYLTKIVNQGIVEKNNNLILHTGLEMLVVAFIGGLSTVGVGYIASKVSTGFSKNIRQMVFSKVESFSLNEFNKFSTASLITRSTNDIQQIQMVLGMILRMVLQAPITGVWAIYKAYQIAPSMTWIMALAVGIMLSIITVLFALAIPKFKLGQKLIDQLNLVTRQNLTGLRVIKAFNNERKEQNNFKKANTELTDNNLFVSRLMICMQPLMMLVFNLTSLLIVWVGASLIQSNGLLVGDMLAFMQYAMQVIMSFLMISIIFIMVPRASVSAQRVMEVIDTEPSIKDPEKSENNNSVSINNKTGVVEFKDVTFRYPKADAPVIENISFVANPGQTTAIIGSTGSGKSTLINLIPRFYDVSEGEILVDGINIKKYKLDDLYKKIGYVPQKGVLFSGTVSSNIKYGVPEAQDSEVAKFAKIAQAEDFIENLDKKYDSVIAQGGANVSGGQKQRLSIARAIIKKPEIYIFDDSFSALDFKTDAVLRQALNKEIENKTVIIVAQRIGTILSADQIIVLDDGKIVGIGTHEELLDNCAVYQEIAYSQLSEKELGRKRIKK